MLENARQGHAVSKNIEDMEKSGEIGKKCPSPGNSFSANLRCLDFKIFWGSMHPKPVTSFQTCGKNLISERVGKLATLNLTLHF